MGSGASQPATSAAPVTRASCPYPVQQPYPSNHPQQHQQPTTCDPYAPPTYQQYMSCDPPPRESSPPPPPSEAGSNHYPPQNIQYYQPPSQLNTAELSSNLNLLQSYGEQDYALREMTWPMEQAFPGVNPVSSPTVSNVTSQSEMAQNWTPSCEMLLTAQDVREGEAFIAEMEQKRQEYESTQAELLRQLKIEGTISPRGKDETAELIKILCQSHHFLYGGHEDELGIEFEPSDDINEDSYILEQIESLSQRHHKELIKTDRLCAEKLLEGHGASMTEQKLDSILEEHIKLRGYMRTRQTKDQVEAYYQVQANIRRNPELYKSTVSHTSQAQLSKHHLPPIATQKAQHPIVQRLPPIAQAKLKNIKPIRGKTVTVDTGNHVFVQQPQTLDVPKDGAHHGSIQGRNLRGSPVVDSDLEDGGASDLQDGKLRLKPQQLESASIWAQSSMKVESSDSDEEPNFARQDTPELTGAFAAYSKTQQASAPSGFAVVSANPKYIASVDFGDASSQVATTVSGQSAHVTQTRKAELRDIDSSDSVEEKEEESMDLNRTGVIPGLVSNRLSHFSSASQSTPSELHQLNSFEKRLQSRDEKRAQRDIFAEDYEDDFDEEEDLVAQYKQTLGGGKISDAEESMTSSDRAQSSRADIISSDAAESEDEEEHSKLMASAKLNNDLTDALWENKEDMNPHAFKALISMWQEKQQGIKQTKHSGTDLESQRINGQVLWQKAKERVMYDAINGAGVQDSSDEEEESGVSDGWSQSTGRGVSASMQTSLTRNQSASVQTESIGVDAETLVDEFFTDDSEKKKIKKMDRELAEQFFSGELSEDEIKELLARNRENIEKLRLEREAKRLKSLNLLREKKGKKKHQHDEEDDTAMDEETKQRIEQIDDKVTRKLIKHRENISEKDMKRLLNEARKQQDDIIRQRNIERVKQNELMRKRLLEKKRAKNQENGDDKNDNANKAESAEDSFYKNLQMMLAAGDLTHAQFKTLIENHLAELSQNNKQKPVLQEDESKVKEARAKKASSIVRKSHEKNRAILDMRRRERDIARAELQQKMKMKREKSTVT